MVTRDKAYTLIELLVSVTIVLVLTVVGVASYNSVGKNARDARRKSDLEKIRVAMEIYKQESSDNEYPAGLDILVTDGYIDAEPKDPRGFNYLYTPGGTFKTYSIDASMELDRNTNKANSCSSDQCFTSIKDLLDANVPCGCVCNSCSPIDFNNCSIKGCNYEVKNP